MTRPRARSCLRAARRPAGGKSPERRRPRPRTSRGMGTRGVVERAKSATNICVLARRQTARGGPSRPSKCGSWVSRKERGGLTVVPSSAQPGATLIRRFCCESSFRWTAGAESSFKWTADTPGSGVEIPGVSRYQDDFGAELTCRWGGSNRGAPCGVRRREAVIRLRWAVQPLKNRLTLVTHGTHGTW